MEQISEITPVTHLNKKNSDEQVNVYPQEHQRTIQLTTEYKETFSKSIPYIYSLLIKNLSKFKINLVTLNNNYRS